MRIAQFMKETTALRDSTDRFGSFSSNCVIWYWGNSWHTCICFVFHVQTHTYTHTRTHTQLFYGSLDFLQDNLGEPVRNIHPLTQSSLICFPHLLRSMDHGILTVQFMCLRVFPTISLQVFFVLPLGLAPSTSYISSSNHCPLFAAHAHTITICFAVVPKLRHLILVSLNPLLGTLSCSLMPHIHLTILISAWWSATSFSFPTGQVSLPCNILLHTQLLYNLPLTINDISLLVSNQSIKVICNACNVVHKLES